MTPRRALVIAVALALAGGFAAQAAAAPVLRSPGLRGVAKKIAVRPPTAPPPLELSANGTRPDLLVDAAGTAHIVWNESTFG